MTVLATLVDPLKREVAVPGTFADVFPNTSNGDLIGTLADAFAQAKLMGRWFPDVTLDISDSDKAAWSTTPDLSDAGGALVVIYAATRMLRSLLRSSAVSATSRQRYKAGPVEVETDSGASATAVRTELEFLEKRLNDLIDEGTRGARTCSASQVDAYLNRVACGPSYASVGGFFPYEYLG